MNTIDVVLGVAARLIVLDGCPSDELDRKLRGALLNAADEIGISQRLLAERLGVTKRTLANWRRASREAVVTQRYGLGIIRELASSSNDARETVEDVNEFAKALEHLNTCGIVEGHGKSKAVAPHVERILKSAGTDLETAAQSLMHAPAASPLGR